MDDEIFSAEFYRKLNRFKPELLVKNAAGMSGNRKSKSKGNSVEFSDFREYMLGDDIRRIDWNAYGRFDRLFVKLFMEEKECVFRIILDGSGSMGFGDRSKEICAKRIAGALAYSILDNSDRACVGMLKGNMPTMYKGVTGKQGFGKITNYLNMMKFGDDTDLYKVLKKETFGTAGVTVFISDMYTDNLEDILKYLAMKKQQIILIRVLSREEADPSFEGYVRLIDSEDGNAMRVTMNRSVLKEYKGRLEAHTKYIEDLCIKYNALFTDIVSDAGMDELFHSLSMTNRRA